MSNRRKPRPWPTLPNDDAAAKFVDEADLGEYDWSRTVPVSMERGRNDSQLNIRLPGKELASIRKAADREGIPLSRFVRMMIARGMESTR